MDVQLLEENSKFQKGFFSPHVLRYRETLERHYRDLNGRRPIGAFPLTDRQINLMTERYALKHASMLRKESEEKPTKPKGTLDPIRPRSSDEKAYEKKLRTIFNPLMTQVRSKISEATAAKRALDALEDVAWNDKKMLGLVDEEVDAHAVQLQNYHKEELVEKLHTALGLDIRPVLADSAVRPLMNEWRRKNISLIRTIPHRLHQDLYDRMTETFVTHPFDQEALAKIFTEAGNLSDYNLRRITRDQTSKAISQLDRVRNQQIGIEEYYWSTSGDERVRLSHRALHGSRQRYDRPPAVGNPGEDIQCRCIGYPILPERFGVQTIEPTSLSKRIRNL